MTSFSRGSVKLHCRQTVEKYLKALLVWHQVEFPKTHDLGRLPDRLATADAATAASLRFAEILTRFAVEVRYPGDSAELLLGEDAEAVKIAQCVRGLVTSALPL